MNDDQLHQAMSQALEQRVEELEKKVAELSALFVELRTPSTTLDHQPDDESGKEVELLERDYRQEQT